MPSIICCTQFGCSFSLAKCGTMYHRILFNICADHESGMFVRGLNKQYKERVFKEHRSFSVKMIRRPYVGQCMRLKRQLYYFGTLIEGKPNTDQT